MMRVVYYTTASVGLAIGVVLNALHQRSNFYAACVYLAQSNACLMILTNVALLAASTTMLGLQKLFYGPLRPIEVEQLYEKAWFAVTETCLAMTIFREEVGARFFVMFVCLLAGKIWGWIGEGRVEVLEQQPPSNPALFHARLSTSLFVSTAFSLYMLSYSAGTVLQHARPNMMVMFAFEFAVLCITSSSTCGRYLLYIREAQITRSQYRDRQLQLRQQRVSGADGVTSSDQGVSDGGTRPQYDLDSGDVNDLDVPGWEEKGRWTFYLELATDFSKLVLYLTFFCVLCVFYGMPIHIIRDVALTIRSFHKRILDFIRYRQATKDMNTRYPDASDEEVNRENCCIICREEMKAWQHGSIMPNQLPTSTPNLRNDERLRPKKLPCGHVLHFACLRSWLERQQNCPTCRSSVLLTRTTPSQVSLHEAHQVRRGVATPAAGPPTQPVAGHHPPQQGGLTNIFRFGPLRILLGARNPDAFLNRRARGPQDPALEHRYAEASGPMNERSAQYPGDGVPATTNSAMWPLSLQLRRIEQELLRQMTELQLHAQHLSLVHTLHNELTRLRMLQSLPNVVGSIRNIPHDTPDTMTESSFNAELARNQQPPNLQPAFLAGSPAPGTERNQEGLPDGISLPQGWTCLPLRAYSAHHPPQHTYPLESSSVQSMPEFDSNLDSQQDQEVTSNRSPPKPAKAQNGQSNAGGPSQETARNDAKCLSEKPPPQADAHFNTDLKTGAGTSQKTLGNGNEGKSNDKNVTIEDELDGA